MSTAERAAGRRGAGASSLRLFLRGRWRELPGGHRAALLERRAAGDAGVEASVRKTIEAVRERGDAALRERALRFDGAKLERLEISREILRRAWEGLEPGLGEAIAEAAANIRAFHEAQRPAPLVYEPRPGVRLGRRADPLDRVAVYAPGGRAAYPSSVLMGVVPARVAGVREVIVTSPPGAGGLPPAVTLAAAHHAGADRFFLLGGAGAVAAFAFGTESVPVADKLVGPGNAWVNEAKRQLAHRLASDIPAGPSEVLVIADESADAEQAAAELLAQAEHDPRAACVLAAIGSATLARVEEALGRALPERARHPVIEEALAARGALLEVSDLDEALAFCAEFAPEHLFLAVREPRAALERVRNAGTVLLGEGATVAFGDYTSGANHVLPTGGTARAHSGLSLLDFVRWTSWQEVDRRGAAALAPTTVRLAESEGLEAHAEAARLRGERAGEAVRSPKAPPRRLRREYLDLHVYRESGGAAEIDLSDNTNRFGTAPAARRVLAELGGDAARYPSLMGEPLKDALSERFGLERERLLTGCGSDDLIDCAMRAFGGPGARVAFPVPTFVMIDHYARANGVGPRPVPLRQDLALDVEGLLATGAEVLYVARPNNPTGTQFEREAVLRLVDGAPGVVIVDEAYAEIAEESLLDELRDRSHVLVFRTFSKAYGLAGLRAGWGTGAVETIAELEKARGPFKLSIAAERAATAAVREDGAWIDSIARETREQRERLVTALAKLGLAALPSAANFVFVPVADDGEPPAAEPPARRLDIQLRRRGIAVRAFPGAPVTGDAIRVTVAPAEQLERLLKALPEALAEARVRGTRP